MSIGKLLWHQIGFFKTFADDSDYIDIFGSTGFEHNGQELMD
jgi:hypothetical protein